MSGSRICFNFYVICRQIPQSISSHRLQHRQPSLSNLFNFGCFSLLCREFLFFIRPIFIEIKRHFFHLAIFSGASFGNPNYYYFACSILNSCSVDFLPEVQNLNSLCEETCVPENLSICNKRLSKMAKATIVHNLPLARCAFDLSNGRPPCLCQSPDKLSASRQQHFSVLIQILLILLSIPISIQTS